MAKESYITFFNGQKMPIVGLGTWQSSPEEIHEAVNAALEVGYRHIDTAFQYENEKEIGLVLKEWFDSGRLRRENVFIVTKLPMKGMHAETVEKYLKKSLTALQLSYIDLYLLHLPCGLIDSEDSVYPVNEKGELILDPKTDHISIWKAMEAQVDAGRVNSIGLSNFNSRQIARIVKASRIQPANLQIELNVHFQQRELTAFCKALDITICAYAPIGSPGLASFFEKSGVEARKNAKIVPLDDPVVIQIAKQHEKTPAQILLRHCIQRDIIVIPKSINPNRIKENFQVFDFELTKEDMEILDSLDKRSKGRRFVMDFRGLYKHPEHPYDEPY